MVVSAAPSVRIVPTAEFHIPGLHAALDEVARGAWDDNVMMALLSS